MLLGIDLGGTNIKYGLFSNDLELKQDYFTKTHKSGGEYVIEQVYNIINNFDAGQKIDAIGIGFPAVIGKSGFVHFTPNIKGFNNINLQEKFSYNIEIPLAIENDANIAALAELELGSSGISFLYISLGTGIGGTIVYNNKLLKGMNYGGGELGFSCIDINDSSNPDKVKQGILESYLGKNKFLASSSKIINNSSSSSLKYTKFGIRQLAEATESGDSAAIQSFDRYGYILGRGIASALNFIDLNTVVIGGGLSHNYNLFADTLQKTITEHTLPNVSKNLKIKKAFFSSRSGIYGGAVLAKYLLNKQEYIL